jgi:hypothetical protein
MPNIWEPASEAFFFSTSVEGGLSLSLGYKLRDFYDLKNTAAALDIHPGDNEDLFMMGYAGMFFYGYKNTGEQEPLRCHDRDYKSTDEDNSFLEVIDNWWEIHTNG